MRKCMLSIVNKISLKLLQVHLKEHSNKLTEFISGWGGRGGLYSGAFVLSIFRL